MLKIEVYWWEYCGNLVSYAATIATCEVLWNKNVKLVIYDEYFARVESKYTSKFVHFFIREIHNRNWIEKISFEQ